MMGQLHLRRFRVMTQRIELGQIFALFCERRESRYRKKQEEYCGPYQDALGAMGIHRLTSFPVEQSESPLNPAPWFKQFLRGSPGYPLIMSRKQERSNRKLSVERLSVNGRQKWAFFLGKGMVG